MQTGLYVFEIDYNVITDAKIKKSTVACSNPSNGLLTTHLSTINNLQVYDLSGKLVHAKIDKK